MNKYKVLWFDLDLGGLIFDLKGLNFEVESVFWVLVLFSQHLQIFLSHWKRLYWLKNLILGVKGMLCVLVLFLRDLQMFPSYWKRRSWLTVLILKVEGTFICLFSLLGIFNLLFFPFRRECLDLEGLSLGEIKFDLRGNVGKSHWNESW